MKTTQRLERALEKLYTAFRHNTLHPECCKQCAVGNICDNTDSWRHLSDAHGSLQLNYTGRVHQQLGRRFHGYTPLELLHIEAAFLKGCGYALPLHHKNARPAHPTDTDTLFKGLCAAVGYLCALDGMPNGMDTAHLLLSGKQWQAQAQTTAPCL